MHRPEIEVMDLYDRGFHPSAIVGELGMPLSRVRQIITGFREKNEDHWESPAVAASARLRDACLALQARGVR